MRKSPPYRLRILTPRRPLRTAPGDARTARGIGAQEDSHETISGRTPTGHREPENYVAPARRSRRHTVAAREEIAPLFLPHAEHHSAPATGAHNHPTLKPCEQHKHPFKVRQLRPAQTCNHPLLQGCPRTVFDCVTKATARQPQGSDIRLLSAVSDGRKQPVKLDRQPARELDRGVCKTTTPPPSRLTWPNTPIYLPACDRHTQATTLPCGRSHPHTFPGFAAGWWCVRLAGSGPSLSVLP